MDWAKLARLSFSEKLKDQLTKIQPELTGHNIDAPFLWHAWWWSNRSKFSIEIQNSISNNLREEYKIELCRDILIYIDNECKFSENDIRRIFSEKFCSINPFENSYNNNVKLEHVFIPCYTNISCGQKGSLQFDSCVFANIVSIIDFCQLSNLTLNRCSFVESMIGEKCDNIINLSDAIIDNLHIEIQNCYLIRVENCQIDKQFYLNNGINTESKTMVDLRGTRIGAKLDLSGVTLNGVPQLEGARLPFDIRISERDSDWPPAQKQFLNSDESVGILVEGFNDRRSYEILRKHMSDLERHYLKHLFMRREYDADLLWAWAQKPKVWATVLFLGLYKYTSDYGNSVWRPLGCWLGVAAVATALHAGWIAHFSGDWFALANPKLTAGASLSTHGVGEVSARLRDILAFLRLDNAALAGSFAPHLALQGMFPLGFEVDGLKLGVVQQIVVYAHKALSTSLLFLFGLAVRNRIKMT